MIYFISGHRDLSYEDFEKYYIPEIDKIMRYDIAPKFIVGDCCGVDKFAMDYIYRNIEYDGELEIYHMYKTPRNTPLNIPIEEIYNTSDICFIGGFKSDEERDSAMTKASDCDIAFIKDNRWNSGTAQNIKRRHNII